MLNRISSFAGTAFDPTFFLSCTVSNVICCLVFGQRFSYDDKQFLSLLRIISEAVQFGSSAHGQVRSENGSQVSAFKHLEESWSDIWQTFAHPLGSPSQMYNVFPRLMEWLPGRHHEMFDKFEKVRRFTMEKIKEHQDTLDPSSPRDYIDCFLMRLHQVRRRLQPELGNQIICFFPPASKFLYFHSFRKNIYQTRSSFTTTWCRQCWICIWQELKPPAQPSDTHWMCWSNTQKSRVGQHLYTRPWRLIRQLFHQQSNRLIVSPHYFKEKMQQEIDTVIGPGRCPYVEDRKSLPFTDAVLHEIQRYLDIVPFSIPHYALHDISFRGYTIPKVFSPHNETFQRSATSENAPCDQVSWLNRTQ